MVRVILDNRCSTQHAKHVIEHNILFHHFLMGVYRHANTLFLRLKSEAISDCFDVVRIHILHDFAKLPCIWNECKLFIMCTHAALSISPKAVRDLWEICSGVMLADPSFRLPWHAALLELETASARTIVIPAHRTHPFGSPRQRGRAVHEFLNVRDILGLVGLNSDNDLQTVCLANLHDLAGPCLCFHVHDGRSLLCSKFRHVSSLSFCQTLWL